MVSNGKLFLKKWLEPKANDSIYTLERKAASASIELKNEVPEYNLETTGNH
jgi:hypothetical protein